MKKLILMSILIATIWLPVAIARDIDLRKGVRLAQKNFLIYCVIYVITIVYVLPRL